MNRLVGRFGTFLFGYLLLAALGTLPVFAESGVWELVQTKPVNGTVSNPGGWQITVKKLESGSFQFSTVYDGNIQEVDVAWTPPPARLVPDTEISVTISASNPVVKPFPFPWNHAAIGYCYFDRFGLNFDRTSGGSIDGPRVEVPVSAGAGVVRSATGKMKIPNAGFGGESGKMVFRVTGSTSGPLGIEYTYQWMPSGGTPGGGSGGKTEGAPDRHTDNTSWNVGHPVPWVFRPDGTVGAEGLWTGKWTVSGDTYTVTIVHQGITDRFTVKFAPDGKSMTAFKDGRVYRTGRRQ
ncbi:MAG: hypothetical protein GX442_15595 [Candidatus Riflebacteria bacterium]|nr:hypothetical protein [Candidatus Riflebacteria bacterium]